MTAGTHRTRGLLLSLIVLLTAAVRAEYALPVGEKAVYSIHWGLFSCGTSTFSCEEVEWNGKTMIRIRVQAKSNWLVSTIYPVDDTVDCYIDPESGQSVRVEKNTHEGDKTCRDTLVIDRENNAAQWTSHSDNIATNYSIEAGACDAVSFLYEFRKHHFETNDRKEFNIVVDTALHGISITAGKLDEKKVEGLGHTPCRLYTVKPKRDDLFVRKIPKEIWLTDDARKILVRMDLQVPVGKARIVLEEYTPPHVKAEPALP